MTLTSDQQNALEQIQAFLADHATPEGSKYPPTAFLLEGGAGTGKTFLLGQLLQLARGIRCVATPTHKACNVMRRKLDAFGVPWVRGYDSYSYDGSSAITGTTAQLLGIGPVITEEQSASEVKFGKKGVGILGKVTPSLLVIDEVSMLGANDFLELVKVAQGRGMKILAVGDAGQLPPVKQTQIPFGKFKRQATLRQIVRQAEGSAIISVAWAIREGKPWRDLEGAGLRKVATPRLVDAFLEAVQPAGERPEEDREVYVAYRNVNVNAVQEKVCQKLYGHGAKAFAAGELVLSETNLYRNKTLLCANQDELVVTQFHEEWRDATIGVPVTLRHRSKRGEFQAHYLSPEELANREHPYNVELKRLEVEASNLQAKYNAAKKGPKTSALADLDSQRRQAWSNFFSWRDQTIISFRHPFAITSHKSQGSTYRTVFVDVPDLARCSSHALYVAVTRPREELVVAS